MNLTPQRQNVHKVLYFSPLRKEKTASLWVDTKTNLWRDFGDSKWEGGDGIHLVRAYLDSHGENAEVSDALRWLRNMTNFVPSIKPVIDREEIPTEKTLMVRQLFPIKTDVLIEYGNNRGIPSAVLKKYFEEAVIFNSNTNKKFFALCMRNDLKGHELRNPFFKGCVGKKYITFIRGTDTKPNGVNIFEGAFDFLSVIVQQDGKPLRNDSIILHSVSNLKKASAYIKDFGYRKCFTWMDNDAPGKEATTAWDEFCKTQDQLLHLPMNKLYEPYKDVNAAHVAKLEL